MSNNITSVTANIGKVDTNLLQVNQALTSLRWDSRLRHPDIAILNSGTTAKLTANNSGNKAVLANTGYLIGTASESISYKIISGTVIHVGFAEVTRDLTTLIAGDDLISHRINVSSDSIVYLDLSTTALTITGATGVTTIDITGYAGQIMRPWLSDDIATGGMSVSIYKTARLSVYVDSEGTVVFETSTSNGVDRPIRFDTGAASLEFTGGQLINDTIHNIIESDPGTPMILRENGGLDVTIDATGTIVADGNVTCTNLTAESLTSPGIIPLVLTSTGANTSLLAVGGDVIVRAGGAGLTITDTTGATTFDSTVTATSFISDSVRSSTGGNLTLYEQSGGGLIIANASANAQFSADLTVLGDLSVNVIASQAAADLDLTETGGLGLHITTGTGVVTSDALIIAPEVRSANTVDLQLRNWAGIGLEIKDTTGDATLGSTLEITSTLYGAASLNLHNNSTDQLGITIDTVSGDVTCDADLNVNADAVIVGSASIGPTPVNAGICFAMSDGGGNKAVLLPRTASHAAIAPVQAGMMVFNTSDQTLRIYNGTVWQTLATV